MGTTTHTLSSSKHTLRLKLFFLGEMRDNTPHSEIGKKIGKSRLYVTNAINDRSFSYSEEVEEKVDRIFAKELEAFDMKEAQRRYDLKNNPEIFLKELQAVKQSLEDARKIIDEKNNEIEYLRRMTQEIISETKRQEE